MNQSSLWYTKTTMIYGRPTYFMVNQEHLGLNQSHVNHYNDICVLQTKVIESPINTLVK